MYREVMTVVVYNKEVHLYTIGKVSKLTGKSVETIRAWEREKVIPTPLFKAKKIRLYHPKEVKVMVKILKKTKKIKKKELQKVMWTEIKKVRKEILNELKGTKN